MYFVGIFKLFSCFLIRYIQTSQSITSLHKILLASQIINLSHSNIMENDSNSDTVESELILPLPAPSASSESETVRHITLGETLKLDELGPIIINTG